MTDDTSIGKEFQISGRYFLTQRLEMLPHVVFMEMACKLMIDDSSQFSHTNMHLHYTCNSSQHNITIVPVYVLAKRAHQTTNSDMQFT